MDDNDSGSSESIIIEVDQDTELPEVETESNGLPADLDCEDGNVFICEICHEQVKTVFAYKKHKLKHSPAVLDCNVCGKTFKNKRYLERHQASHTRKLLCEFCNFVTPHYGALKFHKRMHTGERPFKCSFCENTYIQKYHLDRHVAIHHPESTDKIVCRVCGRYFTSSSDCEEHFNKTHANIKKSHKCNVCNKTFLKKNHLDSHILTHFDERQFACMTCDARFKTVETLRIHVKRHFCKNVECEICGKVVKESSLAEHIRRHSVVKPHTCNICDKGFFRLSELNNHKAKKHPDELESEGMFKCHICDKLFSTKHGLLCHVSGHTKLLECEHCDFSSSHYSTFKGHMKKHAKKDKASSDSTSEAAPNTKNRLET